MKRLLIFAVLLASTAFAAFAAVDGFSGRTGFTCSSCHSQPLTENASVTLDGLPDTYELGATYDLRITVTGGPVANPAGPQGGFELDVAGGTLSIPASMDGLLRTTKHGLTYLPDGTFMRAWEATWTAPGLEKEPGTAYFWLAAVSANGNHNAETNQSVGFGEFGDEVVTLTRTIEPSPDALNAWLALPLTTPAWEHRDGFIYGNHTDENATAIRFQVNGNWQERDTATEWRVPGAATHLQSIGSGRESAVVSVEGNHATPLPLWPMLVLLLWRKP